MSDPLDPGGGDWGDADSSPPLFSPLTDIDVENPSSNSRKRGPSDQNSVLPSKKTSLVQATASIQSTYVCPDLINKNKYSENDSAPFILLAQVMIDRPSLTLLGLPAFNLQMDIVCRMVTIDKTTMITSLKCFWHRP
ncbi:hypothetical protein ACJJTC_017177 [Scirpophaga incertulas]